MLRAPRSGFCAALLVAAVAVTLVPAPAVAADDSGAAALFRAAESAYARHDYAAAAVAFEEANRKDPRAATVYNAGLAWQSANEGPRAADAFAAALALGQLDDARQKDAAQRLRDLEKSLGRVRVTAPNARVTLAHVAGAAAPVEVHVTPGEQLVRVVRSDGSSREARVTAAAGETVEASFGEEAPVATGATAPTPGAATPEATPAPHVAAAEQPPPAHHDATRTWGWIALGGAALASGAAVLIGMSALDARDEFDQDHTNREAHDRAARLRTLTNVAWSGAVALGVTGGVLILTSGGGDQRAQIGVRARF